MSIPKSLTYSIGQTINTGGFSSVRIDFSETIDLETGDDLEIQSASLRNRVVARLVAEAGKLGGAK